MLDFNLSNLSRISGQIKRNIVIYRTDCQQPLYDVKPLFDETLYITVEAFLYEAEQIFDFKLDLNARKQIVKCRKTPECSYTSNHLPNLIRHEATCTNIQTTIEQQVEYGVDKTTIQKLVELGYLPKKAKEFRKSFYTTFDIESLESFDGVDDMKNVEAIHKIVSIAVSTNKGQSRCFVRKNSTHDAVIQMFESFLDYLEEINIEYEAEIPDYFQDAIDHLELMTCDQSILPKSEKMKLSGLKSTLEKYLKQDIFGFNSGDKFYKFLS